ncbi:ankyrin repeat protein, putative, partial [Bodo saltans]
YFTVSQPPYKVQQTVFVHLTFHADRSHAATYLRAQPQQASQASATTQRTQAVQFASFKKDLFTAESLNAASTGEASVPLIIFNCDNIAGFDISAYSTYSEGEVIVLPPSYFTVSQPPYKVQQTVFVHLTFHADRSHAATYLRAQPQQASQASATTQRAQAVSANGIKHNRDQLSLTEVLAELAKVAELRKSLIQEVDPGDTELHTAAQFGNVTAIKALLQLGAKLSAANDAGTTPLFKAAQYGHAEAIQVLWELGADVGAPTLSGVTPLLAAVLGNHADAINVLQDCGADAHERVILTNYPARFQPILFAILSDNASALTALLHHKIDPNTPIAITVDGLPQALTVPLLYIAATLGNIAIVNALIRFGADVDAVSGDGSTTALHAAAHANHVEVVKALMVHSRNVDKSETALHKCPPVELFAMVRGHVEVVKELQKALKQVSESGHRNYFL